MLENQRVSITSNSKYAKTVFLIPKDMKNSILYRAGNFISLNFFSSDRLDLE